MALVSGTVTCKMLIEIWHVGERVHMEVLIVAQHEDNVRSRARRQWMLGVLGRPARGQ